MVENLPRSSSRPSESVALQGKTNNTESNSHAEMPHLNEDWQPESEWPKREETAKAGAECWALAVHLLQTTNPFEVF